MLLMDLKDEYKRALRIVQNADFNRSSVTPFLFVCLSIEPFVQEDDIPYFETVIRYLGGLLSAYAISPNRMLLDRAEELAEVLDPVFSTASGLASFSINPVTFV